MTPLQPRLPPFKPQSRTPGNRPLQRTVWRGAVLLLLLPSISNANPIQLTQREQDWIAAHPVVRVTSDAELPPLEYVEKGQLRGLSADYLALISTLTGLEFEFQQATNWSAAQEAIATHRADMLVNAMPDRLSADTAGAVTLTRPYLVAQSVVFTKSDSPNVWSMDDLAGKRIAARSQGQYADVLKKRYPRLDVMPVRTPLEAYQAVMDGRADAALGTTMTFAPYITRRHERESFISRPPVQMTMTAQFAIRRDWPELESIIEKALSSVSTEKETRMRENWISTEDFGAPTLTAVLRYNTPWVVTIVLLILTLALVAHWAMRARRTAVEGERVKARFLATMSHEIRTPINAIVGTIELLASQAVGSKHQALLEAAEQAAEALTGLLDNVLDLSKLDEGKMQLERVPVEIGALGRSVASIFRREFEAKEINFHVELPDHECWLMIDPTRMRQVLMNLLGNARKFTDSGSVTLAIEAGLQGESNWLHVVVSDTGCGIPSAMQADIFDPYTQADGSVSRRHGGTGLGLAISKELVALMGGTIELHSEEREGTTVSLRIPAEKATHAPVTGAAEAHAGMSGLHVLIVDDHAPNRLVLGEQLSRLGVQAEAATSAHAALAALREGSRLPDLVLMDCFMPEVDGYQACRMIRESGIEGADKLPVVAISAATDAAHLKRCEDSGMNGVLKKPVRLTELRGMLAMWTSGLNALGQDASALAIQQQVEADFAVDLRQMLAVDVVKLISALQETDQVQTILFAHRLHGAAGLIGMRSLSSLAAQIERQPFSDRHNTIARLSEFLEELGGRPSSTT